MCIRDRNKENATLRDELEKKTFQSRKFESENEEEMAKLGIENENLKKQLKKLQGDMSSFKSNLELEQEREKNELRNKIKELEALSKQTEESFIKTKTEYEKMKEEHKSMAKLNKEREDKLMDLQAKCIKLEEGLSASKLNLANALNAIFEKGDADLYDRIELDMSFKEQRSHYFNFLFGFLLLLTNPTFILERFYVDQSLTCTHTPFIHSQHNYSLHIC
eukprot:TRINITY_DN5692_c0_g1_i7.p1 TRINITY_DN5692_c0_g1~~TRINITY_DN5692_c0_g1_i7.p1  ORF type:complete len:243 (+),score=65.24 TRINITY_DN5692_c0_g1_i7:70-729(+)